jgi:hypothetical protein
MGPKGLGPRAAGASSAPAAHKVHTALRAFSPTTFPSSLDDDKALLFIIQYKQIVSTLVWNPAQAREEQETPQIQKRGKYNHNEL